MSLFIIFHCMFVVPIRSGEILKQIIYDSRCPMVTQPERMFPFPERVGNLRGNDAYNYFLMPKEKEYATPAACAVQGDARTKNGNALALLSFIAENMIPIDDDDREQHKDCATEMYLAWLEHTGCAHESFQRLPYANTHWLFKEFFTLCKGVNYQAIKALLDQIN